MIFMHGNGTKALMWTFEYPRYTLVGWRMKHGSMPDSCVISYQPYISTITISGTWELSNGITGFTESVSICEMDNHTYNKMVNCGGKNVLVCKDGLYVFWEFNSTIRVKGTMHPTPNWRLQPDKNTKVVVME